MQMIEKSRAVSLSRVCPSFASDSRARVGDAVDVMGNYNSWDLFPVSELASN